LNKIRADLQFHPYHNKNYCFFDVLQEMEKWSINCLAFLYYCWEKNVSTNLINQTEGEVKENYNICLLEKNVFQFTNKESNQILSIILGQEAGAENQKWHILSIGAEDIKSTSVEGIIEEILEKGGLPIIDHPFADPQRRFKDISKEKEKELINLCSRYKGKIALEWNGYCLPQIRKLLPGCSDINEKVEKLAEEMEIPLIPTTDLHAKNKSLLKEMGTCFIEIPIENDFLDSLKKNILSFNFKAHKGYVSKKHFFRAYKSEILRKNLKES